MKILEGMIPLWKEGPGHNPHPDGYEPPLEACINFTLRGSGVGLQIPIIATGYTTTIKWRMPNDMERVSGTVVIAGTRDYPKVYVLREIETWQLHECEEGRFGKLRSSMSEVDDNSLD